MWLRKGGRIQNIEDRRQNGGWEMKVSGFGCQGEDAGCLMGGRG